MIAKPEPNELRGETWKMNLVPRDWDTLVRLLTLLNALGVVRRAAAGAHSSAMLAQESAGKRDQFFRDQLLSQHFHATLYTRCAPEKLTVQRFLYTEEQALQRKIREMYCLFNKLLKNVPEAKNFILFTALSPEPSVRVWGTE